MTKWHHRIEAAALMSLMSLFRLLGRDGGSAVGGAIGRTLGPAIGRGKVARRNMERALPELSSAEIDAAMRDMWDNLGRTIAEYPNLDRFTTQGPGAPIAVEGLEHVMPYQQAGKPCIFVSGHVGNWELMSLCIREAGFDAATVYRAPNNPLVDDYIRQQRRRHLMDRMVPKGPSGARELVKYIRQGISLCLLTDQKMNDGIEVEMFGRPAMCAPAAASLALRYDAPILPVAIQRLHGTSFRMRFYPPIDVVKTGDTHADIAVNTRSINAFLEERIRERPGQWLWLHRRWKD